MNQPSPGLRPGDSRPPGYVDKRKRGGEEPQNYPASLRLRP